MHLLHVDLIQHVPAIIQSVVLANLTAPHPLSDIHVPQPAYRHTLNHIQNNRSGLIPLTLENDILFGCIPLPRRCHAILNLKLQYPANTFVPDARLLCRWMLRQPPQNAHPFPILNEAPGEQFDDHLPIKC